MADAQKPVPSPYRLGQFEPGWISDTERLLALSTKIVKAISEAFRREMTPDEMETVTVMVNECLKAGRTDGVEIAVHTVAALCLLNDAGEEERKAILSARRFSIQH